MWVTIICFDLAMTMHSSISTTTRNKAKTFLKYLAISLTIPLLFVAPAITLDSIGEIDVGYGKDCWIKDFETRLWSYIAPTALMFVVAFSLLIKTVHRVYKTKRDANRTLGSRQGHSNTVRLAAKLAIVLALIELLNYIQIPGEATVTKSISIFLVTMRSLKGVFICFIFLFNKKVLNLYKGMKECGEDQEVTRNRRESGVTTTETV